MKPSENQIREIPEMGSSFDATLFRRKVANFLRQNKPQEANYYASNTANSFPKEQLFIQLEVCRMIKQRINLLGLPDLKFDDARTEKQRQFFYEGLSNEPSLREKMEKINPLFLSGPDVRCFS